MPVKLVNKPAGLEVPKLLTKDVNIMPTPEKEAEYTDLYFPIKSTADDGLIQTVNHYTSNCFGVSDSCSRNVRVIL